MDFVSLVLEKDRRLAKGLKAVKNYEHGNRLGGTGDKESPKSLSFRSVFRGINLFF
jgi:hypothetical protein